jgi:hypothetical protein
LANFPTSGGGGSSVSYYLNGSVNQGTFAGNTYYEMSKVPVIGAGTNFTINANGYITQFITDANDPSLLEIPAGNWNFEMYFSASSGGGTPSFYVELYKYDGTTFTLIASSSAAPEGITNGTAIDLYTTALAVPTTALTLTDRLAIRVYVTHSGRTITLHTENSNLCQVITTFSTGITALNGLTAQVQYLATGTSGTDFNISSTTATHTFNLPVASATNTGKLSSTDWSTFNSKQNTITLTTTGSSGAATLVGATLNIPNYGSALSGYVPYTGATANLNLGTFGITSGGISSNGIAVSQSGGISASSGATTINGDANGIRINPVTASSNFLSFPSSGSRTYTFPNATGTLALTSDLSAYLPLTGGTLSGALTIAIPTGTGLDVSSERVAFKAGTSFGFPRQLVFSMGSSPTTTLEAKGLGGNYITDFNIITYNASGTGFNVFYGTSAGDVGIGTTSPNFTTTNRTTLDINGTNSSLLALSVGGASRSYLFQSGNDLFINNTIGLIAFNAETANAITFATTNTERMRITSGGNVGIGTSSPANKLTISNNGNAAVAFRINDTNANASFLSFNASNSDAALIAGGTSAIPFDIYTGGVARMTITTTGRLEVKTEGIVSQRAGSNTVGGGPFLAVQQVTGGDRWILQQLNASYGLDYWAYNGSSWSLISNINASTGIFTPLSDINKKKDFEDSTIGLNAILALKPTLYRMKSDETNGNKELGFIAQEVKEFIPQAYVESGDFIGLNFNAIVAALVKSVQELKAEIDELKNK